MDQLKNLADNRLIDGCVYCGDLVQTREHIPSRVFLDSPLPENLPVVGSCEKCNLGYSMDEEYLACLIESTIAGTTDPTQMRRRKVSKALLRKPHLRARLESAKTLVDGHIHFSAESNRVNNVLLKLARGHVAFELGQLRRDAPSSIWWSPLHLMTREHYESFNESHVVQMFGEVGSRGMQRLFATRVYLQGLDGSEKQLDLVVNNWIDVQEDRYRYLAIDDIDGIKIRIVIAEYLGCEVVWTQAPG
jgi:hypothetical protein